MSYNGGDFKLIYILSLIGSLIIYVGTFQSVILRKFRPVLTLGWLRRGFVPPGATRILGADGTGEDRRGRKSAAQGCAREAVRAPKPHSLVSLLGDGRESLLPITRT
jgi:hypothetical protein